MPRGVLMLWNAFLTYFLTLTTDRCVFYVHVLLGAVQLHRIGRRESNPTVVLLVVHLGGVR